MDILIFAETDDKGNFKKDAFEIASYAYEISSQIGGSVTVSYTHLTLPTKNEV